MSDPNYALFPLPRAVKIVKDYIEDGADPGQFTHIVENDLINCMTSLDDTWLPCLHSLVLWFYTEAPAHCIGKDNVRMWKEMGGTNGIRERNNLLKQERLKFQYGDNVNPYRNLVHFGPMETD